MHLRVGRTVEAKDAARGALKSPWWTLGCKYEVLNLMITSSYGLVLCLLNHLNTLYAITCIGYI